MKRSNPIIKIMVLILIFFVVLIAQSRVNEWKHFSSTINFTDMISHEGRIFCTSSGGIVEFDPKSNLFSKFSSENG